MASIVWHAGLIIIRVAGALAKFLGCEFAGMFDHQQFWLVWVVGLSWVSWIWQGLSMILSSAVVQYRFSLKVSFQALDFELLNTPFTAMFSASPLLCRRLFFLHRGFPLSSRTSEVSGFAGVLLRRPNQLSSPMQKRVISAIRVCIVLDWSWPGCRAIHSSQVLLLKEDIASASEQLMIWFFFVKNRFQNCRASSWDH